MTAYAEARRTTVDLEDLLSMVQRQKRERTAPSRETRYAREESPPEETAPKSNGRRFPVTTMIIVVFVIALGTMVTVLKAEITTLKTELGDLKNLKAQMASMDPTLGLASVETKVDKRLGDAAKEQEKMKADLAQLMTGMEEMKTKKRIK
jgi:septal ring factor EnvC (AmiA/AmiB activator)